MRHRIRAVLVLAFLGYVTPGPVEVWPQQSRNLVDRILNPLPDYNPFDKPPPAPRYFPEEVDSRVRRVLIDSLTGRGDALKEHVRFFREKDAQLKKERGSVTGLTEGVLDLSNSTIRDRERYLEAQREALSSAVSPEQKKLIESRIRGDDLSQADELLRKSSANRWGGVLNRLLSSVDLVTILSGSYIGAAVDSTLGQVISLGSAEMPAEERKALVFYLEHLKRHPEDPRSEEIRKQVEWLEKKKKQVLVRREIEKAQEALEKGELARAGFHYDVASYLDPDSREVKGAVERWAERVRHQQEEQQRGRTVVADRAGQDGGAEIRESTALLYALTLRDGEEIQARAEQLEEKYRGTPVAESARDAAAVALEIKGQHEEAKKILQQIARSSTSPDERQRARLLLQNSDYNLLEAFHKARTGHRLSTVKYVLLGEDLLKKNLLYGASPLITGGPAGAASLAAANVIMIGTNLFHVLTANPISNQAVIDKGVEYIRNRPHSESATEVYEVLARAYEEAGMYERAMAYYELSGRVTEKKITELKEKAAQGLLQAAEKSEGTSMREDYLTSVLEYYPESAAAKTAIRKLADLAKIENQGLRLSKKFLKETPELYGPRGLGLKSTLFDGDLSNMELADRGVNLLSETELLLHFQTPWGVRSQSYPIEREVSDRFQIALRRQNLEIAMEDLHTRPKGSPGGIKNMPLALLQGELRKKEDAGDTGATLRLVQEASPSSRPFPKVLDHQLLSESEKGNAQRFKIPEIRGNISGRGLDLGGALPAGLWADWLSVGTDAKSPVAGVQLPIPLLQGFIPIDFLLQGRPGRFSVFPKIHIYKDQGDDQGLFQ